MQDNYEDIAIIILDMIMPEMNGEEFLVEKKKLNITDQIPIIVVSSESKTDIQLSALKLGVNDYITKPFEPEITKQKVKNVLEYNDRFKKMINDCNNK